MRNAKISYWPGDPVGLNADNDDEYAKMSSQRVRRGVDFYESPESPRPILAGCVVWFNFHWIYSLLIELNYSSSIPRWHFVQIIGAEKETRVNNRPFTFEIPKLRNVPSRQHPACYTSPNIITKHPEKTTNRTLQGLRGLLHRQGG